jgi:hypothetical protein
MAGRRRSIYLTDELDAQLRQDGRPLAEILWAGLLLPASGKPRTKPAPRAERATRIPGDFAVTEDMVAWAKRETPHVGRRETAAFIDYWRALPGTRARKLDWEATWRTWMRKAEDQAPGSRPVKTRDQEATDQMFDRAYERAERRDREREGDGAIGEVRPRALPSAED